MADHDELEAHNDQPEVRARFCEFVLRSVPDFAAYVDRDLIYRFCNPSYADATGLSCDEIEGMHAEEILGSAAIEKIRPHLDAVLAGDTVHYEEWVDYKFDGERRYVDVLYVPHIVSDEVLGFAVVVRNITSRKRAETLLKHRAEHDPLTELPNRYLFIERAERALARARRNGTRVALLFADLDQFKPINDQAGHYVGDEVLRAVASRFSGVIRTNETIARVGGDEFVVLVEDVAGLDMLATLAQRLILALENPIETGKQPFRVGVSVGISVFPDNASDVGGLMSRADEAMYQAKREGGNRHAYYQRR